MKQEIATLYPLRTVVTQGSFLGSTLFLMYTVDLPTDEHIQTTIIADDKPIIEIYI